MRKSSFSQVDRAFRPRSFVRFLNKVSRLSEIQATKRRTYDRLHIRKGHWVLDVGCGTGDDVRALGEMVGDRGRVVGIDLSQTMIAEARKRSEKCRLSVEFQVCDAQRLIFADGTFDAYRADRVFFHLSDPRKAAFEICRVLKPGGRLIITEPDYDTLVLDTGNAGIDKKIVTLIRKSVRHSGIAHRLPNLLRDAGLTDISCEARVKVLNDYSVAKQGFRIQAVVRNACVGGTVSPAQAKAWLQHLEAAGRAGRFWAVVTGIGVIGRKP